MSPSSPSLLMNTNDQCDLEFYREILNFYNTKHYQQQQQQHSNKSVTSSTTPAPSSLSSSVIKSEFYYNLFN